MRDDRVALSSHECAVVVVIYGVVVYCGVCLVPFLVYVATPIGCPIMIIDVLYNKIGDTQTQGGVTTVTGHVHLAPRSVASLNFFDSSR